MKPMPSELIRGLEASPWVDSLRLSSEGSRTRLEIALSPSGHERLRDIGLEAFLNAMKEGISIEEYPVQGFEFYPATRVKGINDVLEGNATFPQLLSTLVESGRYRLLVLVDSEMDWFRGHFPGTPVLPGVVQLHWATLVACSIFSIDAPPRTVNRLKFQNVIVPPRAIELEVGQLDRGRVPFAFRSLGVTHSSGVLRFDESGLC